MTRPSFLEGVLAALFAAVSAALLHTGLRLILPAPEALVLVLAGVGFGYLFYLLVRSQVRAGRILLVLLWLGMSGGTIALLAGSPIQVPVQAGAQLGGVWIARCWCFHRTPAAALLDLGLILAGALSALWAVGHTGSLFLAVWSLMLVQALFSVIPARLGWIPAWGSETQPDPFDLAQRAAEAALRQIGLRQPPISS